jgi:two-component system, sensor histidine kinase and response regulator
MKNNKMPILIRLLILAGLYVLGAMIGKNSAFAEDVVLVWPPFGIGLAVILLFGYRYWPAVALGSFIFTLPEQGPMLGFFKFGVVMGHTIGAVLCAYLLERFVKFNNSLERVRDVAGLVCLACLLGTTISATFIAVSFVYAKTIVLDGLFLKMLVWWVPNAMAGLVITPVILTWASPSFVEWKNWRFVAEGCLCAVGLVLGTMLSFNTWMGDANYPLAYLPYPFLVWGALRFGQRGATTGTLLISVVAIHALLNEQGPFVIDSTLPHWQRDSLMLLGSYICILAVTNMLLAAAATERSVAEEAARKSEAMFMLISENVGDMISVTEASGKRLYNSPYYSKVLGLPANTTGMDAFHEIHPDDREKVKNIFQETLRTGLGQRLEFRFLLRDGVIRYIESLGNYVKGRRGQPDKIVSISRDITDRKKHEEALQKSEQLWRAVFAAANDAILLVDANHQIIACNQTAEKMYGYSAGELVGKSLDDVRAVQDRVSFMSQLEDALRKGGARWEAMHKRKDGAVFPVEVSSKPFDAAGLRQFVQIIRDITERKQFETDLATARDDALVAARQKAAFLANMSHEIRTPMNGVIGMTNLLLHTSLDSKQRGFAGAIESSAKSLLAIINDVLDFSKIEAGKLAIEKIDFDLHEAVESAVELLAANAYEKGIELITVVRSNVPCKLRGDPYRVRQILTNLVGNAVKFTEKGEIVVSVSRTEETDEDILIRFEVRDTGLGISRETQSRLFKSFSQADDSTTRRYGGTGLGLAISKQLATLMDGEIGVESELGKGSTFWFTIRLQKQPEESLSEIPNTSLALAGLRVLIVDPNNTRRELIREWITNWKMQAEPVDNGTDAMASLKRATEKGAPFSLAVLDYNMTESDGLSLATCIKSDPKTASTRVILLNSLACNISSESLSAAGIDETLSKPVRQSRMFDCIATVMSNKHEQAGTEKMSNRKPTGSNLPAASASAPRILLAEDNIINQTVALGQLEQLGYTADVANNGCQVLDELENKSYDIILMDCQMPAMDGYEATRRIRATEISRAESGKSVTPVYIIAMTAHAMQGDREKCLAAGMNDYISKPVDEDQLRTALKRCQDSKARAEDPKSNDAVPPSKIVDVNWLSKITRGNAAKTREIVDLYLKQSIELMAALESAVAAGSTDEIQQVAHKFGGSSSTCGMVGIAVPLQQLEEMARENNLSCAPQLTSQIQQLLVATHQFLAEYVATNSGNVKC